MFRHFGPQILDELANTAVLGVKNEIIDHRLEKKIVLHLLGKRMSIKHQGLGNSYSIYVLASGYSV
jgi:hypothetical protein